jgi:hypothetical protein
VVSAWSRPNKQPQKAFCADCSSTPRSWGRRGTRSPSPSSSADSTAATSCEQERLRQREDVRARSPSPLSRAGPSIRLCPTPARLRRGRARMRAGPTGRRSGTTGRAAHCARGPWRRAPTPCPRFRARLPTLHQSPPRRLRVLDAGTDAPAPHHWLVVATPGDGLATFPPKE